MKLFRYLLVFITLLFISKLALGIPPDPPGSDNTTNNSSILENLFEQKQDEKSQEVAGGKLFENATFNQFKEQEDVVVFDGNYLGGEPEGQSSNNETIDAGVVTKIQGNLLTGIKSAFSTVSHYALNLLYLFAVLEVVILGFILALHRDIGVGLDRLFFKVLKIGLIFFLISHYSWLIETIMNSFAKISGIIINNGDAAKYIFNPARIWQYGYDIGIHLLHVSTTVGNNFGLSLIYLILGMGILLIFGLLGIQMVVLMVSFYMVSLGSLILLPFGAFSLGRGMFEKAVQSVFQAGIRLVAIITVIGVALVVWDGFDLANLATTNDFNINQPLGLFFTALLFLCSAYYLPKILGNAVGSFSHELFEGSASAAPVSAAPSLVVNAGSDANDMRAATTIDLSGYSNAGGGMGGGVSSASAMPVTVNMSSAGGIDANKLNKNFTEQASSMAKSISENTVKKIKESVLQSSNKGK